MTTAKFKIKKGDTVIVRTGKDKGKTGEILKVLTSENRVVVQGVNVVKKHTKPSATNTAGGIVEMELSIHASNVALVGTDGKATRAGYKIDDKGVKTRVSKKSGETI
ncbi:MAG: ribosomal protein [Alphaproteobacteria bacterium]|nr:ribosomal protein [Alphaproteobacteria bacterium]